MVGFLVHMYEPERERIGVITEFTKTGGTICTKDGESSFENKNVKILVMRNVLLDMLKNPTDIIDLDVVDLQGSIHDIKFLNPFFDIKAVAA
jgi:hypothetical protein